jgi:hypothetical protein
MKIDDISCSVGDRRIAMTNFEDKLILSYGHEKNIISDNVANGNGNGTIVIILS